MRHEGESLGSAVARIGHDAFAGHLESVMAERWASGLEPDVAAVPITSGG
jgi:hypothetical protein